MWSSKKPKLSNHLLNNNANGILNLSNKNIQNKDIDRIVLFLNHAPHITTLDLALNAITEVGAEKLAALKYITTLDMRVNFIGNEGFIALIQNPTITSLDASINCLKEAILPKLAANTSLINLNISGNLISGNNIKSFENTTLTALNIGWNPLSTNMLMILANHPYFRKLNLDGIRTIDTVIADAFSKNVSLRNLRMTNAHLRDHHAILLANNTTLDVLDLKYNQITNEGALKLLANQQIKLICVEGNFSIDKKLLAIFSEKNPTQRLKGLRSIGINAPIPSLLELCIFAMNKTMHTDTIKASMPPELYEKMTNKLH